MQQPTSKFHCSEPITRHCLDDCALQDQSNFRLGRPMIIRAALPPRACELGVWHCGRLITPLAFRSIPDSLLPSYSDIQATPSRTSSTLTTTVIPFTTPKMGLARALSAFVKKRHESPWEVVDSRHVDPVLVWDDDDGTLVHMKR